MSEEWLTTALKDIKDEEVVRFTADFLQHILGFAGEPQRLEKESQYRPGERYVMYRFQVVEDGEVKVLNASGQLLRALVRYAKTNQLIGNTVKITRIGFGNKTAYTIEPVSRETAKISTQKKTAPRRKAPIEEFDEEFEEVDII